MPEPTVPGWQVVVTPKVGVAFDAPAEWTLASRGWAGGVVEDKDAEDELPDATVRKISRRCVRTNRRGTEGPWGSPARHVCPGRL